MKKKLLKVLEIALIMVIVFSAYKALGYYMNERSFVSSKAEYEGVAAASKDSIIEILDDGREADEDDVLEDIDIVAKLKADYETVTYEKGKAKDGNLAELKEAKSPKDLINELKARYKHIVGRIIVDGTDIDFPIVQGKNNSFYLDHDYKDRYNLLGAVFMDARNKNDFTDMNSIIYGHNVRSGHIFHDLDKLKDEDFVREHPYIIVDTLNERYVYEIAAVYTAGAYEDYRSPSYTREAYQDLLSRIKKKNLINKYMPEGRKMLTLSTCSDIDDRLVIHAVEIK